MEILLNNGSIQYLEAEFKNDDFCHYHLLKQNK